MNHIHEMAGSIYAYDCIGVNYETSAQAAFDALMDAVPDLVWEKSENFMAFRSGKYVVQHEHNDDGAAVWVMGIDTITSEHEIEDLAKDAANTHHREQIRKIWEGDL